MTIQAYEPRKTNNFHPSIMKGAIAMNVEDLEPTTDTTGQEEPKTEECAHPLERAQAWREMMLTHANPEDAALLRELDECATKRNDGMRENLGSLYQQAMSL
jgi:hypothetical protein